MWSRKVRVSSEPSRKVESSFDCYGTRIPPMFSYHGASARLSRVIVQSGLLSMGRHLEAHRCCSIQKRINNPLLRGVEISRTGRQMLWSTLPGAGKLLTLALIALHLNEMEESSQGKGNSRRSHTVRTEFFFTANTFSSQSKHSIPDLEERC